MKDKIYSEGIFEEGYGMIAKSVMRNKGLSIEAKAIYSYFVSFSGAGMSSFPSTELILSELGISNRRYLAHRKQLIDEGYITIERERLESGFSKNIYRILGSKTVQGHFVQEQNVQLRHVSVQNVGTISNSLKSNSIISNSKDIKDIVDYDYKSVIEYLCEVTGKNFRNVEAHRKHIRARYNEGYTLEDFKNVIEIKNEEWKDSDMSKYIQPSTLFGSKFDQYLNQEVKVKEKANIIGDYS